MKRKNKDIEVKISIIMRAGVILASLIMIFSFVLTLIKQTSLDQYEIYDISSIITGLIQLNPYSFMMLGIFVLILTPVIRVISTIILFASKKDKLYTAITIFVLIILIVCFTVGISH